MYIEIIYYHSEPNEIEQPQIELPLLTIDIEISFTLKI